MDDILVKIVQSIMIIVLAPLFLGVLNKFKAYLRGFKGPGLLQVYYNYLKLFNKNTIRSDYSSFITEVGPIIALSASVVVAFMIPVIYANVQAVLGNMFIIIFMLGCVKFFTTLIGLEASSTFGGMGSSRELFLSMLSEPVIFTIILYLFFEYNSFNIFAIATVNAVNNPFYIGNILTAIAFIIVILVENARLPIDNPETHLELTMIHEAMILDLSGKDLLFIELASNIKLVVLITIFINLFIPYGLSTMISPVLIFASLLLFLIKFAIVLFIIAVIEISMAKSRLFRAPDMIAAAFSFVIAAISINNFL